MRIDAATTPGGECLEIPQIAIPGGERKGKLYLVYASRLLRDPAISNRHLFYKGDISMVSVLKTRLDLLPWESGEARDQLYIRRNARRKSLERWKFGQRISSPPAS